ncbi:MAG: DUF1801 domain-containing protein [Pseudomonadota bacterium]
MALAATYPAPPPEVATALRACPDRAAPHVKALRHLILDTARTTPQVGHVRETLKWGEPAYLTQAPKTGTTLRLGWDESGAHARLFVPCQTTLIESWRSHYHKTLHFVGNREVSMPTDQPLPRAELQHCIAMALTYHLRKTAT